MAIPTNVAVTKLLTQFLRIVVGHGNATHALSLNGEEHGRCRGDYVLTATVVLAISTLAFVDEATVTHLEYNFVGIMPMPFYESRHLLRLAIPL